MTREHIKHEVVNTPLLKTSEATCISLALSNSKSLIVSSFYCPKNLSRDDLLKLMSLNSSVFMGGDFNAIAIGIILIITATATYYADFLLMTMWLNWSIRMHTLVIGAGPILAP